MIYLVFIGIYTEPIINNARYRGLYRLNVPAEYWSEKKYGQLYEMSNWYINNAIDGFYFQYSKDVLNILINLSQKLQINKCPNDLIIFGDDFNSDSAQFLGYDINGDEKYLSLIVLMISHQYNDALFEIIFEFFDKKLNKFGLFESEKDANLLVNLYKELTDKFAINIERVSNPKPTKIYKYVVSESYK